MTFEALIAICFLGAVVATREVFWKDGESSLPVISLALLACSLSLIQLWLLIISGGVPLSVFGFPLR